MRLGTSFIRDKCDSTLAGLADTASRLAESAALFQPCPVVFSLDTPEPLPAYRIDIAERRTAEGKPYLFIAIDRTSKFAFARLLERANTKIAAAFLDNLVATVPYEVH